MRSRDELYQRACKRGLALACRSGGLMLLEGMDEEPRSAAKLLRRACTLGDAEGCHQLARLYGDGKGVPRSLRKAFELERKACAAEFAISCHNVAVAYQHGEGTAKNTERASEHFERACALGFADSCPAAPATPSSCVLGGSADCLQQAFPPLPRPSLLD